MKKKTYTKLYIQNKIKKTNNLGQDTTEIYFNCGKKSIFCNTNTKNAGITNFSNKIRLFKCKILYYKYHFFIPIC